MKTTFYSLLFGLAVLMLSCGQSAPDGFNLKGNISGAENLQVFMDNIPLQGASNILGKAEIDGSGNFNLNIPEGAEAGRYRVRVGAARLFMVLDGTESNVSIKGSMDDFKKSKLEVSGSSSASEFINAANSMISNNSISNVVSLLGGINNPLAKVSLAAQYLPFTEQTFATHEALATSIKDMEGNNFAQYANMVTTTKRKFMQERASGSVAVGKPAPNIALPNPTGKEYELEDLKGKVVLIDFWASWCGPCRRANPHVVEMYHKYKDQGFTVYSVSLDGVDSRTRQRFGGNQTQIDQQVANSKKRWVDAIKKDKLDWPYHVSDLKKWECAPASQYGVRGIPRTFLLDRDGKIAFINPRTNLEDSIKKLL